MSFALLNKRRSGLIFRRKYYTELHLPVWQRKWLKKKILCCGAAQIVRELVLYAGYGGCSLSLSGVLKALLINGKCVHYDAGFKLVMRLRNCHTPWNRPLNLFCTRLWYPAGFLLCLDEMNTLLSCRSVYAVFKKNTNDKLIDASQSFNIQASETGELDRHVWILNALFHGGNMLTTFYV